MRKILLWAIIVFIVLACFSVIYLWLLVGAARLTYIGIQVSDAHEMAEVLQIFVQILAIIIAGFWTYERFIKSREDHPYPKIQHRIEHYNLEKGLIYLSVFVTVVNEGKTKLDLSDGVVCIRQVSPILETMRRLVRETRLKSRDDDIRSGKVEELFIDAGQRLGWETLGVREWNQLRGGLKELEPGQTREIQFDFLLVEEDDVKVIEAISYFVCAKSSWELVTLYSLAPTKTKKQSDR
ncbi:MAG: hypothetical protein WA821_23395 [Anaerolineales bacterium]